MEAGGRLLGAALVEAGQQGQSERQVKRAGPVTSASLCSQTWVDRQRRRRAVGGKRNKCTEHSDKWLGYWFKSGMHTGTLKWWKRVSSPSSLIFPLFSLNSDGQHRGQNCRENEMYSDFRAAFTASCVVFMVFSINLKNIPSSFSRNTLCERL